MLELRFGFLRLADLETFLHELLYISKKTNKMITLLTELY